MRDWVRALETTQRLREQSCPNLANVVHEAARLHGDAPALVGTEALLSYAGLSGRANQVSRWAQSQGLRRGDVVAVLMANCPDYVAIWLGLSQIGCVAALLNTGLMPDGLAHCIRSAAAWHVITSQALQPLATAAVAQLSGSQRIWLADANGPASLDLEGFDTAALPSVAAPAVSDPALLIYTSGTTGLPKAAIVSHARVLEWSGWFAGMMEAGPTDRLYNCLPMYHSVGGVVAIGSMLVAGGAVIVREKFSASRFWPDVADSGATIVQYIGELCRYLLQSAGDPGVTTPHEVRLCCGNGLRHEVWEPFQARFSIPRILEFYAATEGGVSLTNCEGRPGAIGRVPGFLAHRFPVALVRCDPITTEVLRDADGSCMRVAADEPGEAIGLIAKSAGEMVRPFDGYTDTAASAKKVLTDVFAPGDRWFRTGDLMRQDAAGYYYFVDRLGDTFRWKGENVSTTEVAGAIESCPGVIEAVVYGVAIPGADGRAGMAALVVGAGFALSTLRAHLEARLPSYARPLFVRLCESIATTGTFKLKKQDLLEQGYAASADPVWFDDRSSGGYVGVDAALLEALGIMRL